MSRGLNLEFMLDGSHQALPGHRLIPQYLFNLTLRWIFNLLVQSRRNCFRHLLWLSVNGVGWDCTVQRSSPHKCSLKSCCSVFNAVVAAFTFRYFYILIIFACAWSSSLSLDLPGGSPKLPKYLLDWYSLYPRRINSSDYIPPSFPYVILHSRPLLIIYSSSDVSIYSDKVLGPIYQFGLLPP